MQENYEIGGTLIGIRSTSKPFSKVLDAVLAEYRSDEVAVPLYSIVVGNPTRAKRKSFHILYESGYAVARTMRFQDLAITLLSHLNTFLLVDRADGIYTQACIARRNGTVAVAPSYVANYLSKVGRRAERLGISVSAERTVRIDPESGLISPADLLLHVPRDAVARLVEAVGERAASSAGFEPTHADVVLITGGDGEPVHEVSPAYALSVLAGNTVNLMRIKRHTLEGLRPVVEGARCYRLVSHTPNEMLTALKMALPDG